MKFSANIGFLWNELPLTDAIKAAKAAGFDAVECHFPYGTPAAAVASTLEETGLPMLGLNTVRGQEGENGLAALPGRERDARRAIEQAIEYAAEIKAKNVHVMAGTADGEMACSTYMANLEYAAEIAEPYELTILMEPLNHLDAPGYFLKNTSQASDIIQKLARPNVKLMFDSYHVQITEGDLTRRLARLQPIIGHIQFASVPDRGPPDCGEIDYDHIFATIAELGFEMPLGAEYRPAGRTEDSLKWLSNIKSKGRIK